MHIERTHNNRYYSKQNYWKWHRQMGTVLFSHQNYDILNYYQKLKKK